MRLRHGGSRRPLRGWIALSVLGVLLAFPGGSGALQDDPIPREFTPGPTVTVLYEIEDPKAGRGPDAKVADLLLFGCEIGSPGFERFTEYQLEELPYEFLFQLPPPKLRPGKTWPVDVTLGAQALGYTRGSALCPRVTGAYGLAGLRKIGGRTFCVVKGKFGITDGRLQPIGSAAARSKAGQTATVRPTRRKIGSLEVELRIQPDTGVLEEAFYRFQLKVQARAPRLLKSGNYVFQTRLQKVDHHRRVVRKKGPDALDDDARAAVVREARDAATRGLESLLAALTKEGTFDIPSNGSPQRQLYLTALAARALRACGHEMDSPGIKASLADLRSRAPQEEGAMVAALGSLAALHFPVTLESPLASLGPQDLGPIDPSKLPPGGAQAITECLPKVAEGQGVKTGLWGRDLSGPRSAAEAPERQSIYSTTAALAALHEAARLGWKVPPDVWTRAVTTLRDTAIPLGAEAAIKLTFAPGSPYEALSKGKKAEPLAWARTPFSTRRGDAPSSAETTFQVLLCLSFIRQELILSKALDAETGKALDALQLGGLAWVSEGYLPRSLDTPGYASNPVREYGTAFDPVLCRYGIEKIGDHDPVLERTILLLRKQNSDGSWNRHRYAGPSFETTVHSILALCRFSTRGW